jgi:hypothetical protein
MPLWLVLSAALAAPAAPAPPASPTPPEGAVRLDVSSSAFAPGGTIPVRDTCDGDNLSPPLAWTSVPDGTRAFALVMDDPDAPGGTFTHWVAWDLPATARSVPEGLTPDQAPPTQGTNGFKKRGYSGPCPPRGHGAHRYFFRLYALDRPLALPPSTTRAELDVAMQGRVLASGELMGKFGREK